MHFFFETGNSSFFTVARLNFARLPCPSLLVINKSECNSTISIRKRISYLQHYLLLRITSSYCLDTHIAWFPLASRVLIGGSTIEKRARHQHPLLRSQEPGKVFRIFLSNFVVFCFFKKCLHILSHRRGKENLADYKYQNRQDQNPSDARSNALRSTHTKEGEKRRAAGRWNSISTWRCWVTGKKCDCSRSSVCRPVGNVGMVGSTWGKAKFS